MDKSSKEIWEDFIKEMNLKSVIQIDMTTTLSDSSAKAYNLLIVLEKDRCEQKGVKFDINTFHEFVLTGGIIKSLELHVSNMQKTISSKLTSILIKTLKDLGEKK